MTKSKPPENIVIEYTDWSRFLPWLTQLAFVLAISLVTARAIMLETLRETFSEILGNSLAPLCLRGGGVGVVLDLACCVPALLILLRRALDKSYIVRFTWGSAAGDFRRLGMLSTIWAGDKFESLVLAFHLVAAAALFWAMAQLVRSLGAIAPVAGLCLGRAADLYRAWDHLSLLRCARNRARSGWSTGRRRCRPTTGTRGIFHFSNMN